MPTPVGLTAPRLLRPPEPPLWQPPAGLAALASQGHGLHLYYVHAPLLRAAEASGSWADQRDMLLTAVAQWSASDPCPGCSGFSVLAPDDLLIWTQRLDRDRAEVRGRQLEVLIEQALRLESSVSNSFVVAHVTLDAVGRGPLAEREIMRAVQDVGQLARDPVQRDLQGPGRLLDQAIRARAFVFHNQPIVDFKTGQVVAWEALCRGTSEGMRFPDVIFSTAERAVRVWDLSRVLRDIVSNDCAHLPESRELFVNIHPTDVDDPVMLEQLLNGSLYPHRRQIVLELTERAAIDDYARVKGVFDDLRAVGYRLAIDDLGSGYAGLTALAELEPDFIKFDMGLIRGVAEHPVKRRLIARMNQFAAEIGARTIAEGVETVSERDVLADAGCEWMQGYYFARPGLGFPAVPPETLRRDR